VQFIASFSVITSSPADDRELFVDALGLPLHPPDGAGDDSYLFSEAIDGANHFGVWPLTEAAQACFGLEQWPASHAVPQASVEFEVDDVAAAAAELEARGYRLLHSTRTEPWGQVIARLQSHDGLVVGVCFTPWLHGS
jgi:catechol 2,3-dioxygenase-like lactoylglutathione lyase family enzyme